MVESQNVDFSCMFLAEIALNAPLVEFMFTAVLRAPSLVITSNAVGRRPSIQVALVPCAPASLGAVLRSQIVLIVI